MVTIALQEISNERIEYQIQEGGAEQDQVRGVRPVVKPGDTAGRETDENDQ